MLERTVLAVLLLTVAALTVLGTLDALTAAHLPRMFAWLGDPQWVEAIGTWAVGLGLGAVSIAVWHHDRSRHKRDRNAQAAMLGRRLRDEIEEISDILNGNKWRLSDWLRRTEGIQGPHTVGPFRTYDPGEFTGLEDENDRLHLLDPDVVDTLTEARNQIYLFHIANRTIADHDRDTAEQLRESSKTAYEATRRARRAHEAVIALG